MQSAYHLYSLGIAAENLPLDSVELNVLPIEKMSGYDGELKLNPLELTTSAKDSKGSTQHFKVQTDTVLTCEWFPTDTNSITPPNVRRGEQVEVWRLADTDKFYWRSISNRNDLRTLESKIVAFAADPTINNDPRQASNSYFFEISTHKKLITIKTSQKNKEPFAYTIQLDTGTGKFTIEDHTKNFIHLDSKLRNIHLKNSTGSEFFINDKDIRITAVRDCFVEVGRDLHTKVGRNETRSVGKARETKIGTDETTTIGKNETHTVKANQQTNVDGSVQKGIKGSETQITVGAKTTTVNGAVTETYGGVYTNTVSAAYTQVAGTVTITTPSVTLATPATTAAGIVTAGGDVTGGGISLMQHTHIGNMGSPTSPPQ